MCRSDATEGTTATGFWKKLEDEESDEDDDS